MELLAVTLGAYKRFKDTTSVRLREPLVAIVGPNEAGKTSLLRAIALACNDAPIPDQDRTRRSAASTVLSTEYQLDDADREAIAHIPGGAEVRRCIFRKTKDGSSSVEPAPWTVTIPPHRAAIRADLAGLQKLKTMMRKPSQEARARLSQRIAAADKALQTGAEYLGTSNINHLTSLHTELSQILSSLPENDESIKVASIVSHLSTAIGWEQKPPVFEVQKVLSSRRPMVVEFDQAARDLAYSYELAKVAADPPVALKNFAKIAGLNLKAIAQAESRSEIDQVEELELKANQQLEQTFKDIWPGSAVTPRLRVNAGTLKIHLRSPGGDISRFDERSEGFRWFVGLVAFLGGNLKQRIILLVDEIETHLSYDAQASLISLLEDKQLSRKVIYTTHSIGSLPSDIGTGVRTVVPDTELEQSKVDNAFWIKGAGFRPLLMAMGLGPMAFIVNRKTVVAEGASECLLLPSLLRQANHTETIGFFVAPGLSNLNQKADLADFLSHSDKTIFLTDGDDSGRTIAQQLLEKGVPASRVRSLQDFAGGATCFEDLIDGATYVWAINHELHLWNQAAAELEMASLPKTGRAAFIDKWCNEHGLDSPRKTSICQLVAGRAGDGDVVFDKDQRNALVSMYTWMREQLAT